VVNADPASHVAARVILDRAGGLDAALLALGAPELRDVVDVVRRSLEGKVPSLGSDESVDAVVKAEQQEAALSPVLERLDKAAAAAALQRENPMIVSRTIASSQATADVQAAAPAPSPTPASSPTPPPADAYRVEPQPETPPAPVVAHPRPQPRVQRAAGPEVDPFWSARQRAWVQVEPLLDFSAKAERSARSHAVEDSARSRGFMRSVLATGAVARPIARPARYKARSDLSAFLAARPGTRQVGRKPAVQAVIAVPRTGSVHESACPQALADRKRDPWSRLVTMLVRFWPGFRPPTGAQPS